MADQTQTPKADLIVYETEQGQQIRLSWTIVREFFLKTATREAAYAFMGFCRATGLDPFKREVYLTEYTPGDYSIITAYQVFMKRANRNRRYKNFKAGVVILLDEQKPGQPIPVGQGGAVTGVSPAPFICLEGALVPPGYVLVGGWCQVYGLPKVATSEKRDLEVLATSVVDLDEYIGRKRDGSVTKMWDVKQATMIRKVPVGQAHRDAFPDELQGMYLEEEMQRRGAETAKEAKGATVVARGPIQQPEAESEPSGTFVPEELMPSFNALGWRPAEMEMWLAKQGEQTVEELLLRLDVILNDKGITLPKPEGATLDTPPGDQGQQAPASEDGAEPVHPDQLALPG